MEYQTSMFRGQPDDEAIKYIQYFEDMALEFDERGYCVCTSEGKDSRVLGHLMRRAGVKHFYLHNNTGIDPPELIYFQRDNFREYREAGYLTYDVQPEISMWRLMVKNRIPPFRWARYCCVYLKEYRTECEGKAVLSLGVRRHESVNRAKNRAELEVTDGKKRILMSFDNTENRKGFEICRSTGSRETRINPIAEWTDADIWNYSEDVKLEQCCLYGEGFTRLGCIGCPMAGEKGRQKEFERWPKYKAQYIRTFGKMIEGRKQAGLTIPEYAQTAQSWFDWWQSDRGVEETDENQMLLWDMDAAY